MKLFSVKVMRGGDEVVVAVIADSEDSAIKRARSMLSGTIGSVSVREWADGAFIMSPLESETEKGLIQVALAALRTASTMAQLSFGSQDWQQALLDVNAAILQLSTHNARPS